MEERRNIILSFVQFGIRAALIIGVVLGFISAFVLGVFASGDGAQIVSNILIYGLSLCIVPSILIGAINGYFAGVVTARQDDPHSDAFMYELKILVAGFCVALVLCIIVFALVVLLDDVKMGYLPIIAFGQIGLTCMLSSAIMAHWHLGKPRSSPAPKPFDRRGEPLP